MVKVTFKAIHSQGSGNWTCVDTPHKNTSGGQEHSGLHSHPANSDHSAGSGDITKTAVIDVSQGDNIHCSNYRFGAQRRVTLYANGKQVATAQNLHGGWVNYSVNLSEIPLGGSPDGAPTYLETLDKLDQWSSAHYVPRHTNRRNILNL